MNWNIFWELYTLAFAVAALLVWYFLYYRKKHYTELCSVKTTGTKSFSSPFHRAKTDIPSNLTTREDLPSVLKLNLRQNSLAAFRVSCFNCSFFIRFFNFLPMTRIMMYFVLEYSIIALLCISI